MRGNSLRRFAQVFGLGLTLLSLGGLVGVGGVLGLGKLLGLSSLVVPDEGMRLGNNILFLLTAAAFLCLGIVRGIEHKLRRDLLTGIGTLYLLSGVFPTIVTLLLGLPLDLYSGGYDLARLAIGLSCVLAAHFFSAPGSRPSRDDVCEGEALSASGRASFSQENDPQNPEEDHQQHYGEDAQDDHFHRRHAHAPKGQNLTAGTRSLTRYARFARML